MNSRVKATAVTVILITASLGAEKGTKPVSSKAPEKEYAPVLWREPVDIASRDLFYGPGGKAHAPHGTFTFLEEDMNGANPKFDVVDQDGVRWRVKLGPEAKPETAATRLAWAIGYFASEDYFMPVLPVEKMKRLRRGRNLVSPGNVVHDVRLKRHIPGEKKVGSWSWAKNPFTGTREWYGLRALMAVLNNWDLKDDNNSVYQIPEENREAHYAVSDLGASFGPTGMNWMLKGKPTAYVESGFIKGTSPKFVDFVVPSGPGMNYYIDFPSLAHCVSLFWIGRHIPREDARWLGEWLGRLSTKQIDDAFRASGYSADEVEKLSATLRKRIGELRKL
jgi:hypothetical protein